MSFLCRSLGWNVQCIYKVLDVDGGLLISVVLSKELAALTKIVVRSVKRCPLFTSRSINFINIFLKVFW